MCDCGKEHEAINTKLDEQKSTLHDVVNTLAYHTAEVHGKLVSRSEIEQNDEALRSAILGPKIKGGLHHGSRLHKEGIEWKVNELWKRAENGGFRTRLTRSDKVALYGPTVGAIAVIIAAALGLF